MGLKEDLAQTRCMFTLKVPEPIPRDRIMEIKEHIEEEVKNLETDIDVEDSEEVIQSLDLLTWLEFKLGYPDKAMKFNDKAMQLSHEQREFTLANRAHLFWLKGNHTEAQSIINKISNLPEREGFERHTKAQQGYSLFRLNNLREAMKHYEESLMYSSPMNLWLLQLGRTYRRATHLNNASKDESQGQLKTRLRFYKQRATELLCEVIRNPSNSRIKAIAFSEKALLLSSEMKVKNAKEIKGLCRKALEHNDSHPLVLLLCGKSLIFVDQDWARKLLERATQVSSSSHAYAALAKCLKRIAQNSKKPNNKSLFESIEESLREAVRLGHSNLPAKVDLAIFLQETGRIKDALRLYTQIIDTFRDDYFLFTLATVYERKAMCLIELSKDPEFMKLPEKTSDVMRDAEQLCIKALAVTFKLFTKQELQRYLEAKTAVKCLQAIAGGRENAQASSRICRLLKLVRDPKLNFSIFKALIEAVDNDDRNAMECTLKTYLSTKSYEAAYTLLEISVILHGHGAVDRDLALEVALSAAKSRLVKVNREAAMVFRQVFKTYSQDFPIECHVAETDTTLATSVDAEESEHAGLDVLIVYDELHSNIFSTCLLLERAVRDVFGLAVSVNLRDCAAAVPHRSLQLDEMAKAKVVLVLLGQKSEKDSDFDALLQSIPEFLETGMEKSNPPRIFLATTEENTGVPCFLSDLPQIDTSPLIESFSYFESQAVQSLLVDLEVEGASFGEEHQASVDNIISFFCFLVGAEWPLASLAKS